MSRSPTEKEDIRETRRAEILAAAAQVFAEKGFAKAKITEIASAAGLSHGLVYHYFPSKDAIFGAIADQMMDELNRELALDHERAIDRLVLSLERRRETIAQPVDGSVVVAQAMLENTIPPDVQERVLAHFERAHSVVVSWIAEAQEQGDIDPGVPAEELAGALFCLLRGMSIRARGMPALPFALPRTDTILRLFRTSPTGPRAVPRSEPRPTDPKEISRGRVTPKKQRRG